MLVHKIAGAAAEQGLELAQVVEVARRAAEGVVTMGIGLSSCTIPAVGKPTVVNVLFFFLTFSV